MKEYAVYVKEFLEKEIVVNAESKDEALTKVKQMYRDEEVVLDENNYVTTEYEVFNERDLSIENIILVDDKNGIEYLRDMEENQFYGVDISGEHYADVLVMKKEKDTLWVFSANKISNDTENKNLFTNYEIADNQHELMKFNVFQYLSPSVFKEVYVELYNAHMRYETRGGEPELYVVDNDKNPQELTAKLLHEQYKKEESKSKEKLCK